MIQEISTFLVDLFENIKDEDDNPMFGLIVDYEPGEEKFAATPYGILLPSDQPADYSTTSDNLRREGFSLYICLPLEGGEVETDDDGTPRSLRKTIFNNMRKLSDACRNAVDKTEDLNGLIADEGKSRVMSVVPSSGGWGIVEVGVGEAVMARVDIIVKYSYNFR